MSTKIGRLGDRILFLTMPCDTDMRAIQAQDIHMYSLPFQAFLEEKIKREKM